MSATLWPVKRLDTVATIITGNTPPTSERSNYGGKHLFVGPGDIGSKRVILAASKTLSDRGFSISRPIPTGATLFVCIGSTIGKTGIAGRELATNQQINALVAGNELDAKYLYWAATTLSRLVHEQAGEQAVPLVNKSHFGKFEIAVPTLSEQRAIANAIDETDDFIELIERLIQKKRAIKQGMMQELLTGRTRLPGFNDDWVVRKIGEFTDVRAGGTPSTTVARYWGDGVRWMSSGEIHLKRVHEVSGRITQDGLRESAAQLLPARTVLMALAGQGKTRGTVAVSRVQLSTNQSIAGILPSEQHDSDFLFYNLDTRYEELRGESSGDGGRGGLNLTIIKRLEVLMPRVNEQHAIAGVLSDVDDEIDAIDRQVASAHSIKQGMMQELLTGRTRLPVDEVAA